MKKKPGFYYCDVYQDSVWFFIGWSQDEVAKYLAKSWKFAPGLFDGGFLGKTIIFEDDRRRAVVIWTEMDKSNEKFPYIIAHECVHAAGYILSRAGVRADFDNDEAMAYLVGTLVRKSMGQI